MFNKEFNEESELKDDNKYSTNYILKLINGLPPFLTKEIKPKRFNMIRNKFVNSFRYYGSELVKKYPNAIPE